MKKEEKEVVAAIGRVLLDKLRKKKRLEGSVRFVWGKIEV